MDRIPYAIYNNVSRRIQEKLDKNHLPHIKNDYQSWQKVFAYARRSSSLDQKQKVKFFEC